MPLPMTQTEAQLFHHFIQHLGRWLDCTNAARIFTLAVSENALSSPILLNAVLCFSARHKGVHELGERAYERCIELLIERLGRAEDAYDDGVLSAVLLLHFADQLDCRDPSLRFRLSMLLVALLFYDFLRCIGFRAIHSAQLTPYSLHPSGMPRQTPSQRHVEHLARLHARRLHRP